MNLLIHLSSPLLIVISCPNVSQLMNDLWQNLAPYHTNPAVWDTCFYSFYCLSCWKAQHTNFEFWLNNAFFMYFHQHWPASSVALERARWDSVWSHWPVRSGCSWQQSYSPSPGWTTRHCCWSECLTVCWYRSGSSRVNKPGLSTHQVLPVALNLRNPPHTAVWNPGSIETPSSE